MTHKHSVGRVKQLKPIRPVGGLQAERERERERERYRQRARVRARERER